jgi:hypothetical protein
MTASRFYGGLFVCLLAGVGQLQAQEREGTPAESWQEMPAAGFVGCVPYRLGNQVRLDLTPEGLAGKELTMPRLFTSLRSANFQGSPATKVEVVPEPTLWRVRWQKPPAEAAAIVLDCDWPPLLAEELRPIEAAGDGSLFLHGCWATTRGEKLRYEPQSHKNTVGFWTKAEDEAFWSLTVARPGRYAVAILQGCGKGQGGSDAVLTIGPPGKPGVDLSFSPIETGHFQNFRWVDLGSVVLESAGQQELRVKPTKIAKAALCDIRAISLVPQSTAK